MSPLVIVPNLGVLLVTKPYGYWSILFGFLCQFDFYPKTLLRRHSAVWNKNGDKEHVRRAHTAIGRDTKLGHT
jgi:hypothetical protein